MTTQSPADIASNLLDYIRNHFTPGDTATDMCEVEDMVDALLTRTQAPPDPKKHGYSILLDYHQMRMLENIQHDTGQPLYVVIDNMVKTYALAYDTINDGGMVIIQPAAKPMEILRRADSQKTDS